MMESKYGPDIVNELDWEDEPGEPVSNRTWRQPYACSRSLPPAGMATSDMQIFEGKVIPRRWDEETD